jgi:hypothetical protein
MPSKLNPDKYLPYIQQGGQFSAEHLVTKVISGTTSGTANTPVAFAHGLGYAPIVQFVRRGNAYISSVDATNVNVASAAISQAFEVVVMESKQ